MSVARDRLLSAVHRAEMEERLRHREVLTGAHRLRLLCRARRTSMLLVDHAAREGVCLTGAISATVLGRDLSRRPGASEPRRTFVGLMLADDPLGTSWRANARDHLFESRFEGRGSVLRAPSHPLGRFGVAVVGDALVGCFDLGPARMVVGAGAAVVRLPEGVPDSVAASLACEPLDRVVEHPLLAGRGLVVDRVDGVGRRDAFILTAPDRLVDIDLLSSLLPA